MKKNALRDTPPPLPDEIIEQTRQLLDDAERPQWALGDLLVAVLDELGHRYEQIFDERRRAGRAWLIKHIADRTGAATSTLRDREVMARFWTEDLREKYSMLTYHQLRAVKSAGENWKQYADWAALELPPVAVIRAKIKNHGHEVPAWLGRWERACTLLDAIARDEMAPGKLRSYARIAASLEPHIVASKPHIVASNATGRKD